MDFRNYTFYMKPPAPNTRHDILFVVIVNIIAACLLVGFYYLSLNCRDTCWPVRPDIPSEAIDLSKFHSGDILLVFLRGHDFILFPGHMGVVVELPQYRQKYVWDLPNPFYHAPNVLKPLHKYMRKALAPKNARLYVHHLENKTSPEFTPTRSILKTIKKMSASIHYKLQAAHDHADFLVHTIIGLPGIPDFLPSFSDGEDLHYCSSAILNLLIHCGVLNKSILENIPVYFREHQRWKRSEGSVIYPQMFISGWDLSKYVNPEWSYSPLHRLFV